MKFVVIPVTPYQQNSTLLWCEETRKGAVVDPGGDLARIEEEVRKQGVELEKILVTHGHLDHVGGVAELARRKNLPIEGPHKDDDFWIQQLPQQAQMMSFPPSEAFVPDRWLQQGDSVQVGKQTLEVRHCPGHTPGHVIFFHRPSKVAMVGDVLFQGSIGRTDFPRGDYQTLIDSIRNQLWPLGDEVQFIPGHGPFSTFGHERRHNPFVADMKLKQ
ncbi:MAG: MBL fold metallo-hydrolase [Gammaproteobacteria bacterium]|uniref:MBL fold metallo-hydrolase n=1 Tax=Pseudomaricurvus alcaniphilus TaxID=1166482 RepID=UPI00140C3FDF|nr:MBL fold metallo-hydrolase [Pseudomaricurvus alcaniphilus]MBR9909521.1 MBL fold metallo-hydrolase [Gammaproteobacteria bacterium]NHN37065.1 MBL fold metallo-hydrolase [Pseudomaricurvus alcaniphilus]